MRAALTPQRERRFIGLVMLADVVVLTAMLFLTGGSTNPFALFFLVNVVLSAVLLPPRWAWSFAALAVAGFALLAQTHVPLPQRALQGELRAWGLLVGVALATAVTVTFVTRVSATLARRERELRRQRELQDRAEKLHALGTLAAGAAHELGSPLATIAVTAVELQRSLDAGGDLEEAALDAALIREEVSRCRRILDRMSHAREDAPWESVRVGELLERVCAELPGVERVQRECDPRTRDRTLRLPLEPVTSALRGIVHNALDATPAEATVVCRAAHAGERVLIEVRDPGSGMDEATQRRAREPFFTTKEPGAGMGLGLYLAGSLFEELGGSLEIESTPGEGTLVFVELPLSAPASELAS